MSYFCLKIRIPLGRHHFKYKYKIRYLDYQPETRNNYLLTYWTNVFRQYLILVVELLLHLYLGCLNVQVLNINLTSSLIVRISFPLRNISFLCDVFSSQCLALSGMWLSMDHQFHFHTVYITLFVTNKHQLMGNYFGSIHQLMKSSVLAVISTTLKMATFISKMISISI